MLRVGCAWYAGGERARSARVVRDSASASCSLEAGALVQASLSRRRQLALTAQQPHMCGARAVCTSDSTALVAGAAVCSCGALPRAVVATPAPRRPRARSCDAAAAGHAIAAYRRERPKASRELRTHIHELLRPSIVRVRGAVRPCNAEVRRSREPLRASPTGWRAAAPRSSRSMVVVDLLERAAASPKGATRT